MLLGLRGSTRLLLSPAARRDPLPQRGGCSSAALRSSSASAAKGFLGLRGSTRLLLSLCGTTSVLFRSAACLLVGSLAFKFGLGRAKGFFGLRKATGLLLGLRGSTRLLLSLCGTTSVLFRSAACLLVGSLTFKLGLGDAKGFLGLRKATGLLLGLRGSTRLVLSLCRTTSVLFRSAAYLLLGSLAFKLGLGRAKGFLGLRKATGLLLGLRGSTRLLLSLCRTTSVLFRSAACLLLGSLAFKLGPVSAARPFLRLARGDGSRELLAPVRLFRVDGVALGERLPLLRKLQNSDRRSPFPHHLGTIELSPRTLRVGAPEPGCSDYANGD